MFLLLWCDIPNNTNEVIEAFHLCLNRYMNTVSIKVINTLPSIKLFKIFLSLKGSHCYNCIQSEKY